MSQKKFNRNHTIKTLIKESFKVKDRYCDKRDCFVVIEGIKTGKEYSFSDSQLEQK